MPLSHLPLFFSMHPLTHSLTSAIFGKTHQIYSAKNKFDPKNPSSIQELSMAKKLLLFLVLLSGSSPVFSQSDEFTFHGFNGAGKNISLNGVAEIEQNGILRLTNYSSGVLGHAFYSIPIEFKNSTNGRAFSFSTAFAFAIVPQYAKFGGHGFAFTIAKSKELKGALPRQYLGLLNQNDNGNFSNHLFAVEFDTVPDYEFKDINGNHIGIDINSLVSNISVNGSCFSKGNSIKQKLNLQSGKIIQAWVDYDSVSNLLNVTLSLSSSKPNVPILSFPVDLSPIFLEYMYVGFSASTGILSSSHYISGWSFKINGQAQSLDLSSLPSVPRSKKNHLPLILVYSLSAAVSVALAIGGVLYMIKKFVTMDVIEPWELDIGPHRYSYKELKKATGGFRDEELIGFGGFGRVYKGTLPNTNAKVAVKQINNGSKHGMREFISEIETIGRLRHRNLVQLLGWCRRRDDLFLVYDFMSNGSLDKYIFDEPKLILSWEQRCKIIRGVASGLLYLHEEWEQTVIHRDIKAGNVLLDSELNGRLGDFGLAKLYEHGTDPSTTKVVGTLGYLAPELTKTGKPTTSSDVFAYGALLLEIVCGRKPIEVKALPEELSLVDWVWEKWQKGSILEVVDTRLKGEFDEGEVVMVLKLGLMCSNNAPAKRPSMRQVVSFLKGEVPLQEVMVAPDEYGGKKFVSGRATSAGADKFLHSYLESSFLEKVGSWSSVYDSTKVVDLEAGSTSTLSASFTEDERFELSIVGN